MLSTASIQLPPDAGDGALLLGYSGGLDSMVLLHLLAQRGDLRQRGLRALHVHHGLHADADAWARHCGGTCAALDVPLQMVKVAVDHDGGDGPEAAARKARQHAFADALGDGGILVLAHHQDDQAETFLLRALRASGVDGLAAMRPWRRFAGGWLWRPLLDLPRSQLLAYARHHGLRWIEDPSNADTAFDRNFLRRRVLPLLRERWPHADAALARSAALAADATDLLDGADAAALAAARAGDERTLSVQRLLELPRARRARVLRRWMAGLALPPLPGNGIAAIEGELLDARPDARAQFVWRNAVLRRWRDLLHADSQRMPLAEDYRAEWDGQRPLRLPTGDALTLLENKKRGQSEFRAQAPTVPELPSAKLHSDPFSDPFSPPLLVRARHGGERIVLPGRSHSHSLKHVLQDLAIPPWLRERLPLLCAADGSVLAAGDLALSARLSDWLRARGLRLAWLRDDSPP